MPPPKNTSLLLLLLLINKEIKETMLASPENHELGCKLLQATLILCSLLDLSRGLSPTAGAH